MPNKAEVISFDGWTVSSLKPVGSVVKKGEQVVFIEWYKLGMAIYSPFYATVEKLHVKHGDLIFENHPVADVRLHYTSNSEKRRWEWISAFNNPTNRGRTVDEPDARKNASHSAIFLRYF